jgi:hypothetical protein
MPPRCQRHTAEGNHAAAPPGPPRATMPRRRAPIRFVGARGGGARYATARWLQVFAITGKGIQSVHA